MCCRPFFCARSRARELRPVSRTLKPTFPCGNQRFTRPVAEPRARKDGGPERSGYGSATSRFQNPEAEHADRELQKLIREAVARLGKTAGEMFVLRYYEGYDNQEIAKMLDTSQMVVGVVLHRARTKLRKEIGHYLEKHHEQQ